jgi:hypothetical protein
MNALLRLIALLTEAMTLVPVGTAFWNSLSARKQALEDLISQGKDAKWSDEQWNSALADQASIEARIDANAARAQNAIDNGSAT